MTERRIQLVIVEPIRLKLSAQPVYTIGTAQAGPRGVRGYKGDKGDAGISTYTYGYLHEGIVTGRNINIVAIGYVPIEKEMIHVLPDSAIVEGAAITISINGGTPIEVLNYTSHDLQYSLVLIFLTTRWGIVARQAESYTIKGENFGVKEYATKKTGVDSGYLGQEAYDDDYSYICVVAGTVGVAVWKKSLMFKT